MYRICTEDVNRESIQRILDAHVDGYGLFSGVGCWKGQHENSVSIDLIGASWETVRAIAEAIKVANNQESVLVYEIPVTATFV
jgi:hypothetical protein